MLNGKLKKQVMPAAAACLAIVALLLVVFQMVRGHEQAHAITGAWYTTYPGRTADGEEYAAEYILQIDRAGTCREIFFNGKISSTMSRGRWQLDEDTLNLFNEPESDGFWWRLIGREEQPTSLTQWKIISATPSSLTVQGYGVTLNFVEHTTQREEDIRFLMEAWNEKRPSQP